MKEKCSELLASIKQAFSSKEGLIVVITIFTVAFFVAIFSKDYRKKALITMVTCVITCIIGFGICANNFSLGAMH